jgi:hypothetical protein
MDIGESDTALGRDPVTHIGPSGAVPPGPMRYFM